MKAQIQPLLDFKYFMLNIIIKPLLVRYFTLNANIQPFDAFSIRHHLNREGNQRKNL